MQSFHICLKISGTAPTHSLGLFFSWEEEHRMVTDHILPTPLLTFPGSPFPLSALSNLLTFQDAKSAPFLAEKVKEDMGRCATAEGKKVIGLQTAWREAHLLKSKEKIFCLTWCPLEAGTLAIW